MTNIELDISGLETCALHLKRLSHDILKIQKGIMNVLDPTSHVEFYTEAINHLNQSKLRLIQVSEQTLKLSQTLIMVCELYRNAEHTVSVMVEDLPLGGYISALPLEIMTGSMNNNALVIEEWLGEYLFDYKERSQ